MQVFFSKKKTARSNNFGAVRGSNPLRRTKRKNCASVLDLLCKSLDGGACFFSFATKRNSCFTSSWSRLCAMKFMRRRFLWLHLIKILLQIFNRFLQKSFLLVIVEKKCNQHSYFFYFFVDFFFENFSFSIFFLFSSIKYKYRWYAFSTTSSQVK